MRRPVAPSFALAACLVLSCVACTGAGSGPVKPLPNVGGAGNGEVERTPAEVLADARSALLGAASVHAVGDLALPGGAVSVDLMLTHDGSVSGSLARGERRLQVLRTMGDVPTAFVRGDSGLAADLGAAATTPTEDAFVAVPAGVATPVAGLSVQGLADRILPAPQGESPSAAVSSAVSPGPSATVGVRLGDVDGARAVVVTAAGATVSVSDDGPPRPLRVVGGPSVPGVLTFTDDVVTPLPTLPGTLTPTP